MMCQAISMAVRSKAQDCDCSIAGIKGSNPADDMEVCLPWLLRRSNNFFIEILPYMFMCVSECNLETSTIRCPMLNFYCCVVAKKKMLNAGRINTYNIELFIGFYYFFSVLLLLVLVTVTSIQVQNLLTVSLNNTGICFCCNQRQKDLRN